MGMPPTLYSTAGQVGARPVACEIKRPNDGAAGLLRQECQYLRQQEPERAQEHQDAHPARDEIQAGRTARRGRGVRIQAGARRDEEEWVARSRTVFATGGNMRP